MINRIDPLNEENNQKKFKNREIETDIFGESRPSWQVVFVPCPKAEFFPKLKSVAAKLGMVKAS